MMNYWILLDTITNTCVHLYTYHISFHITCYTNISFIVGLRYIKFSLISLCVVGSHVSLWYDIFMWHHSAQIQGIGAIVSHGIWVLSGTRPSLSVNYQMICTWLLVSLTLVQPCFYFMSEFHSRGTWWHNLWQARYRVYTGRTLVCRAHRYM